MAREIFLQRGLHRVIADDDDPPLRSRGAHCGQKSFRFVRLHEARIDRVDRRLDRSLPAMSMRRIAVRDEAAAARANESRRNGESLGGFEIDRRDAVQLIDIRAAKRLGQRRTQRSGEDRIDRAAKLLVLAVTKRIEHLEGDEHVQIVVRKIARNARGVFANERRRVALHGRLQLRIARKQRRSEVAKNGGDEIGIRVRGVVEHRRRHVLRSARAQTARRFPAAASRCSATGGTGGNSTRPAAPKRQSAASIATLRPMRITAA